MGCLDVQEKRGGKKSREWAEDRRQQLEQYLAALLSVS